MSVLIRNMEMPKNCWECSLSDIDDDYGRCCLFSGIACLSIGRQDNCPLIEIEFNEEQFNITQNMLSKR